MEIVAEELAEYLYDRMWQLRRPDDKRLSRSVQACLSYMHNTQRTSCTQLHVSFERPAFEKMLGILALYDYHVKEFNGLKDNHSVYTGLEWLNSDICRHFVDEWTAPHTGYKSNGGKKYPTLYEFIEFLREVDDNFVGYLNFTFTALRDVRSGPADHIYSTLHYELAVGLSRITITPDMRGEPLEWASNPTHMINEAQRAADQAVGRWKQIAYKGGYVNDFSRLIGYDRPQLIYPNVCIFAIDSSVTTKLVE